jgi:hypothetical protein
MAKTIDEIKELLANDLFRKGTGKNERGRQNIEI